MVVVPTLETCFQAVRVLCLGSDLRVSAPEAKLHGRDQRCFVLAESGTSAVLLRTVEQL